MDTGTKLNKSITEIVHLVENHVKSNRLIPYLMGDLAGSCLFLFYYSRAFNDARIYELAMELLHRIVSFKFSMTRHPTYCSGICGIGWLIEFIKSERFVKIDTDDILSEVDTSLHKYMQQELSIGHYDFLHGGMGPFYYYLCRDKNPDFDQILSNAVCLLDKFKRKQNTSIYWDSFHSMNYVKEEGTANLGLAHGIPSIVVLLSKYYSQSKSELAYNLINESVEFLLSSKNNVHKNNSIFPYKIEISNKSDHYSRLGWCYGDLGVAIALLHAGKALQNDFFKAEAFKIVDHSILRKDFNSNQVVDAGLCHGSAGIAQIFRKFYKETNDSKIRVAADFWMKQTLEHVSISNSVTTGKVKWDSKRGYVECFGLLEGITGVGLSLVSLYSDYTLAEWEKVLLIS